MVLIRMYSGHHGQVTWEIMGSIWGIVMLREYTQNGHIEKILMEMDWSPPIYGEFLWIFGHWNTYGTYVHQTQFQRDQFLIHLASESVMICVAPENLLTSNTWLRKDGSPPKTKGDEVQLSKIACHIINIHGIYIIQKSYNQ